MVLKETITHPKENDRVSWYEDSKEKNKRKTIIERLLHGQFLKAPENRSDPECLCT